MLYSASMSDRDATPIECMVLSDVQEWCNALAQLAPMDIWSESEDTDARMPALESNAESFRTSVRNILQGIRHRSVDALWVATLGDLFQRGLLEPSAMRKPCIQYVGRESDVEMAWWVLVGTALPLDWDMATQRSRLKIMEFISMAWLEHPDAFPFDNYLRHHSWAQDVVVAHFDAKPFNTKAQQAMAQFVDFHLPGECILTRIVSYLAGSGIDDVDTSAHEAPKLLRELQRAHPEWTQRVQAVVRAYSQLEDVVGGIDSDPVRRLRFVQSALHSHDMLPIPPVLEW